MLSVFDHKGDLHKSTSIDLPKDDLHHHIKAIHDPDGQAEAYFKIGSDQPVKASYHSHKVKAAKDHLQAHKKLGHSGGHGGHGHSLLHFFQSIPIVGHVVGAVARAVGHGHSHETPKLTGSASMSGGKVRHHRTTTSKRPLNAWQQYVKNHLSDIKASNPTMSRSELFKVASHNYHTSTSSSY